MSLAVASGALSVQSAIRATNGHIDAIRQATPRSGFPHDELLRALPNTDVLSDQVDRYLAEVLDAPTTRTQATLTFTATVLEQLHAAAQRIRSAVEWSSEFAAIDWWISRRIRELALGSKMILVVPGPLGDFRIEKTSRFRDLLCKLGEMPQVFATEDGNLIPDLQENVDLLRDLHLLQVPSSEGTSPAWRPLVLGHELAHLRFTRSWVRDWLTSANPEGLGELAAEAIAIETSAEYRARWLKQLENWLLEVACDSASTYFYGEEANIALASHLAAHSDEEPGDSHPAPPIRLAIQTSTQDELDSHRPKEKFTTNDSKALDALLSLALLLKEHVYEELSADVDLATVESDEVASLTMTALVNGELPSAHTWGETRLGEKATTLESGLVRGLWMRRNGLLEGLEIPRDALLRDEGLIGQAVDALEFAARFDEHAGLADANRRPQRPTPNVLWISEEGVRTEPGDSPGEPSHDLRLGRHFIVFQRNAVSNLSALGEIEPRPAPIQRSVEVGWGDEFILHPAELVLAATFEEVRLSRGCVAQVLSRSSMGRLGLLSATAVHIQPGFVGCLTLELVNLASVPLRLTPGQRIAQVVPSKARGESDGYEGAYQFQRGRPQFSLAEKDWDAEVLRAMRPGQS